MKHSGKVTSHVVVLDPPVPLPEGATVQIERVSPSRLPLGKRLKRFAGTMSDLPADMAENHDHYLHRRQKR